MGWDTCTHSHDAAHKAPEHPFRVDNKSRFSHLAPTAEWSNSMAVGPHCILQHRKTATACGHRLCGLPEARSVEGLSKCAPTGACRELPTADLIADIPIVGNERQPKEESTVQRRETRHSVSTGRYPRTYTTHYTTEITAKGLGTAHCLNV
jgi:hypothetical protein